MVINHHRLLAAVWTYCWLQIATAIVAARCGGNTVS